MAIVLMLAEIFTVIMQRNVCEKAFDRRQVGMAAQVTAWVAFYIISNVFTYFFEIPSWLKLVIFSVLFFGVLSWLYEGSVRLKLVLVIFLCLIGMLSEVIVCFIGILCGIDMIHMLADTEVVIMYTILSKLVWLVEIKFALLFLKKNKNVVIKNMDWLEVFIVPVSSIFIVMAMFMPFTDQYVWLKLVASLLVLVINLFTFYNYNELQEKAWYQAERQFLTQQVENYAVQLQEMSKTWQQTREYRHDMKQKYLLIQSYLNRNEYEKIRELYQQSVENLKEEDNLSKTGNVSFDTIVNYKVTVARKNNIKVKLDTMIPYDMKWEDVDLYSLLGNLFDNAIEAAGKVDMEEREIKVLAKMSRNNLYLEMENPYVGNLKKQGQNYLTTKMNKNEHGLGLQIIENIINRHNGQMIIDDKDNYFKIKVLLYNIGK